MQIILSSEIDVALDQAAQKIVDTIAIDTYLFVSGGSSFEVFRKVDELLTEDQKQLTRLMLADERYGLEGHDNSNWNLFSDIDTTNYGSIYPVLDDQASMQECADEYDQTVQMALESDAQTIAILGAGSDSHIAGIKPMDEKLFVKIFSEKYFASYIGPDYERLTMTPSALLQIDLRVCYTTGVDKATVIASLINDTPFYQSPIHILKDVESTFIYNVS